MRGGRVGRQFSCLVFVFAGAEPEISLEIVLCGHYRGKLRHREVYLVETLPPHVSEKHMWELVGLLSIEGGNVGPSGPASSSQLVVGVKCPTRFPSSASADILVVGQAGKGTTHIRKKQSVRVVLSSEEETESDDVSLHPRKM